jgi:hypothetical protein
MVIWGLPESLCQCWAMDDVTEGRSPSGATLRHKLVFGRSVRTVTMMQSCASAAKLRGGGPILNRGSKTIVLHRVAATSVRHLQLAINRRATCRNPVPLARPRFDLPQKLIPRQG